MIPDPVAPGDASEDASSGRAESSVQGEPAVRVLVGLGNPGPKYAGTRHNVGFDVLDQLAERLGIESTPLKVGGREIAALYRAPDDAYALVWPMTFMNRSGQPTVAAIRAIQADHPHEGVGPDGRLSAPRPVSVFVIVDDFHLPLGALRIRDGGSPGGHNGLKSMQECLGGDAYGRMRIGVGDPGGTPDSHDGTVDFVLNRFRRSQEKLVEETLETSSWAAEDWIQGASIEDLQGRYNRRKAP